MSSFYKCVILAVMFTMPLFFSRNAKAAEFRSPRGFHLSYPDNWQTASEEQQANISDAARQLLPKLDIGRFDAVLFNQADPTQNVNIIVAPQAFPAGQDALPEVESALRAQFNSAGISAENIECKCMRVGNYDAICSTWTASLPAFGSQKMLQKQLILSGKSHGYIITCTTTPQNAAATEPAFAQITNSFQIDFEPDKSAGEWWDCLPTPIRNGVIGGGIGLAFALFSGFAKSAKGN